MTQTAFVKKILDAEKAEVLVQRSTACGGSCESCGGACGESARLTVVATNKIGAAVGDKVQISTRSSLILSSAALLYLPPLAAFFLGYAVASAFSLSELWSAIIGLGFLLGSFGITIPICRRRKPITFSITGID